MRPRAIAIKLPRSRERFERHWLALGATIWRTHLHTKRRGRRVEAILR